MKHLHAAEDSPANNLPIKSTSSLHGSPFSLAPLLPSDLHLCLFINAQRLSTKNLHCWALNLILLLLFHHISPFILHRPPQVCNTVIVSYKTISMHICLAFPDTSNFPTLLNTDSWTAFLKLYTRILVTFFFFPKKSSLHHVMCFPWNWTLYVPPNLCLVL